MNPLRNAVERELKRVAMVYYYGGVAHSAFVGILSRRAWKGESLWQM